MDDLVHVREVEDARQLGHEVERVGDRERAAGLDPLLERRPRAELHHVERTALRIAAGVDHRDDPRVVEPARDARLDLEAAERLAVELAREEDLERERPLEADPARGEHDAVGAAPELAQELVVADPLRSFEARAKAYLTRARANVRRLPPRVVEFVPREAGESPGCPRALSNQRARVRPRASDSVAARLARTSRS